jgi:YihY family inner membrane protein
VAAARERAEALPGGALVREIVNSERELGGGLIAGGVAFRLFLWLVPFGLVIAALLSFWSVHDEESLESASKKLGIGAAAAEAASSALQGGDRNAVFALAFGLVFLVWFSLGAIRALNLAFSLAWELNPPRIRRRLAAVLLLNGLFAIYTLDGTIVAFLREEIGFAAITSIAATLALTTAVLLVAMWELPHRATRVRELLPGALLVAVGVQLVQIAVLFYFAPRLGRSEETYGALGVAATMLIWLYVMSRLLTGGAFLNAALWRRRLDPAA